MACRRVVAALFALFLAVPTVVYAQSTVPATPTVTPSPNCDKPGEPPSALATELGKSAAEMKRNNWTRSMKAYLDCLKQFVDEQQAAAGPHIKAANAAVEEYNKAIKIYNDQLDAASK